MQKRYILNKIRKSLLPHPWLLGRHYSYGRLHRSVISYLRDYRIDEKGCWIYLGVKNYKGYGTIPKHGFSHRVSFNYYFGFIPNGKMICHHCDNPPCINPDHLFAGTSYDNQRDCVKKGRHAKFISDEAKVKISVSLIGNKRRLGHKPNITDSMKLKLSIALKGNKNGSGHKYYPTIKTREKHSIFMKKYWKIKKST
jgi:hypothetical protein